MKIVVDTSVIIAVLTNEKHKEYLLEITNGHELIAPKSVKWEIGNAFSAMLKRKRITLEESILCIDFYNAIPINYKNIDLKFALEISQKHQIYAYDAYLLVCSFEQNSYLLTLDKMLEEVAKLEGIKTLEVK